MTIQLPVLLNDGSSLLMDADFDRRLKEGDASIGWTGDERLGVYYANGCLELRRLCEDGELRVVMRARPGMKVLDTQTLRFLAEHDSQSRRAYDARADMDKHNDTIRRDAERHVASYREAAAEKLRWALRRDIGAHVGGSSHVLMPLAAAPWKNKDAAT
jgi:hypothetical protein